MMERFDKLFARNVYVHHYSQFMDVQGMRDAREQVEDLCQGYRDIHTRPPPSYQEVYRPRSLGFI
jgi:hypothetical protein